MQGRKHLLGMALAALFMASTLATEVQAPPVRFTTDAAFDASGVAAYARQHDDIYRHIDANMQAHLGQLQRWVKQPSVSARIGGSPRWRNSWRTTCGRSASGRSSWSPPPVIRGYSDIFTERLGLPMVMGGLGHGSGAHAPNEYMVVEPREGSRVAGLAQIEKWYVDFLHAFAEMR